MEDSSDSEKPAVTSKDFYNLIKRAQRELNIGDEDVMNLPCVEIIQLGGKNFIQQNKEAFYAALAFIIVVVLPSSIFVSVQRGTGFGSFVATSCYTVLDVGKMEEAQCLAPTPEAIADYFRPPVDCSECADITGVKRVKQLSPTDFLDNYAFTMQPVLIEDAQNNWTAGEFFNFTYFRKIYSPNSEALEKSKNDCQFFPYQTELEDLEEFFNMSKRRVEGKEKPWYVGWSNCDGKAANQLRQHYKIPYFIPPDLDHSNIDWIFMGLPGYGANMHIDNVGTLSWQAQIKGTKKWTLKAPSECQWRCIDQMEIIVNPGDIIVLDTNKWFHATEIIGNETSIVIGSEYY